MSDVSIDARVLITTWFAMGPKSTLRVGGRGCQNVLSDRADAAMNELIEHGYVTASRFNDFGRMEYVGTAKCIGRGLSFDIMETHAGWSATKPNPERTRTSQDKGEPTNG